MITLRLPRPGCAGLFLVAALAACAGGEQPAPAAPAVASPALPAAPAVVPARDGDAAATALRGLAGDALAGAAPAFTPPSTAAADGQIDCAIAYAVAAEDPRLAAGQKELLVGFARAALELGAGILIAGGADPPATIERANVMREQRSGVFTALRSSDTAAFTDLIGRCNQDAETRMRFVQTYRQLLEQRFGSPGTRRS